MALDDVQSATTDILAGKKVTKKFRGPKDPLLSPNQIVIEKGQLELRSAAGKDKLKVPLVSVEFASADVHRSSGLQDKWGLVGKSDSTITLYAGGTVMGRSVRFGSPSTAEAAAAWISAVVLGTRGEQAKQEAEQEARAAVVWCSYCGIQAETGSRFCNRCGAALGGK